MVKMTPGGVGGYKPALVYMCTSCKQSRVAVSNPCTDQYTWHTAVAAPCRGALLSSVVKSRGIVGRRRPFSVRPGERGNLQVNNVNRGEERSEPAKHIQHSQIVLR